MSLVCGGTGGGFSSSSLSSFGQQRTHHLLCKVVWEEGFHFWLFWIYLASELWNMSSSMSSVKCYCHVV